MSKGTTIISDLRSFFSENENNRAINAIMRVMECINIRPDQIGTEKKENCKFTNMQVLNLLVLFPFFVVRNVYRYSGSSLSRLFCCEKDMFYRFMNDGNIKWRKLLYAMNLQLLRKIRRSTEAEHDKPVCLITSRHIKCHLIGMIKLGKTKYHTQWGDLTANQIIKKLQKQGLTKHNRTLKCTYCTIDVKFAGTTVRLFFSKRGRNGHWNGLLTTDLSLSFLKAYRTYATRWTTEVAYHDCKQLLDFGRCQSVHFSAQIASELLSAVIDANPKFHKLYQMYKLVA